MLIIIYVVSSVHQTEWFSGNAYVCRRSSMIDCFDSLAPKSLFFWLIRANTYQQSDAAHNISIECSTIANRVRFIDRCRLENDSNRLLCVDLSRWHQFWLLDFAVRCDTDGISDDSIVCRSQCFGSIDFTEWESIFVALKCMIISLEFVSMNFLNVILPFFFIWSLPL